jgi:hypothetical protein
MSSSISSHDSVEAKPTGLRDWALIAGWVTGPSLFLTALEVNYALANGACVRWPLHLVVIAGVLLSAAAGMWAWRAGAGAPPHTRRRFMAAGGLALSAGSVLLLLCLEAPVFALPACVS